MNTDFVVCIHYENDYGSISYNEADKSFCVKLANEAKRREIETYLSTEQTIHIASGATIRDFADQTGLPTESLAFFKQVLTRLYNHTQVLVDWSHPVIE
ncbi:MAG: hypothetical protein E6713_05350 [Sporomusaceae bacterium]|nr:hypothetical protein [Sporomusaceae bacterium]